MFSISLPSLADKHYDLAEKEGNSHSRHFERDSGSIFIAGKLRGAHKSTTFVNFFKLTAKLKFHYRV